MFAFKVSTNNYAREDSFPLPWSGKKLYFFWYNTLNISLERYTTGETFSLYVYRLNKVRLMNPEENTF